MSDKEYCGGSVLEIDPDLDSQIAEAVAKVVSLAMMRPRRIRNCSTCVSWDKPHENKPTDRECDRLLVFTPATFGCTEWERKL